MSNRKDLLAYADDVGVVVRSWSTLKKVIEELKKLDRFGLIMNDLKGEIVTNKNINLPEDTYFDKFGILMQMKI